jgi:hypothetical protein
VKLSCAAQTLVNSTKVGIIHRIKVLSGCWAILAVQSIQKLKGITSDTTEQSV